MNVEQEIIDAIDNNIMYGYKCKWAEARKEKLECLSKLNVSLPQQGSEEDNLGKVSFSDLNKEGIETGKRCKLRITRFLNRKLNLNDLLLVQNIEEISNLLIKKLFKVSIQIRIDKGLQITKNYKEAVGGGSCMTGCNSKYTKLYEMNPDRFEQIVVTYINDSARAILCTLDNGEKSCERIYGTSLLLRETLREYAKDNNFYNEDTYIKVMTGLNYKNGHVPYFDGFYYHKKDKGKLSIFTENKNKEGYARSYDGDLSSTEGRLYPIDFCCNCSDVGSLQIQGDFYCESCAEEIFKYCDSCESYQSKDRSQIIQGDFYCETCTLEYAFECLGCGTYFHYDDRQLLENDELCPVCYADRTETCNNCELVVYSSNIEDGLCKECIKIQEEHDE